MTDKTYTEQELNAAVDERVQAKVAELQADFEAAVQAKATELVKALEANGAPIPVSAGGYDAAEAERSAAARDKALAAEAKAAEKARAKSA